MVIKLHNPSQIYPSYNAPKNLEKKRDHQTSSYQMVHLLGSPPRSRQPSQMKSNENEASETKNDIQHLRLFKRSSSASSSSTSRGNWQEFGVYPHNSIPGLFASERPSGVDAETAERAGIDEDGNVIEDTDIDPEATPEAYVRMLQARNIRTIINFDRDYAEANAPYYDAARAAGITVIDDPENYITDEEGPEYNAEHLPAAVQLVNGALQNGNVIINCAAGENRSGLIFGAMQLQRELAKQISAGGSFNEKKTKETFEGLPSEESSDSDSSDSGELSHTFKVNTYPTVARIARALHATNPNIFNTDEDVKALTLYYEHLRDNPSELTTDYGALKNEEGQRKRKKDPDDDPDSGSSASKRPAHHVGHYAPTGEAPDEHGHRSVSPTGAGPGSVSYNSMQQISRFFESVEKASVEGGAQAGVLLKGASGPIRIPFSSFTSVEKGVRQHKTQHAFDGNGEVVVSDGDHDVLTFKYSEGFKAQYSRLRAPGSLWKQDPIETPVKIQTSTGKKVPFQDISALDVPTKIAATQLAKARLDGGFQNEDMTLQQWRNSNLLKPGAAGLDNARNFMSYSEKSNLVFRLSDGITAIPFNAQEEELQDLMDNDYLRYELDGGHGFIYLNNNGTVIGWDTLGDSSQRKFGYPTRKLSSSEDFLRHPKPSHELLYSYDKEGNRGEYTSQYKLSSNDGDYSNYSGGKTLTNGKYASYGYDSIQTHAKATATKIYNDLTSKLSVEQQRAFLKSLVSGPIKVNMTYEDKQGNYNLYSVPESGNWMFHAQLSNTDIDNTHNSGINSLLKKVLVDDLSKAFFDYSKTYIEKSSSEAGGHYNEGKTWTGSIDMNIRLPKNQHRAEQPQHNITLNQHYKPFPARFREKTNDNESSDYNVIKNHIQEAMDDVKEKFKNLTTEQKKVVLEKLNEWDSTHPIKLNIIIEDDDGENSLGQYAYNHTFPQPENPGLKSMIGKGDITLEKYLDKLSETFANYIIQKVRDESFNNVYNKKESGDDEGEINIVSSDVNIILSPKLVDLMQSLRFSSPELTLPEKDWSLSPIIEILS